MASGGRRIVLSLLVLLAILIVAQRRLSNGEQPVPSDALPALWESAEHGSGEPGTRFRRGTLVAAGASTPAMNCAIMISTRRDNPFTLTSVENGVRFDIDADGDLDQVAWTESGADVAFLAMDRDGDGSIVSGRELIGDHALPGAKSGPTILTVFANNAIGGAPRPLVDSENPLFAKLVLWTDANHNGISEPPELRSAAAVLSGISLGFESHHRRDPHGNESRRRGFVFVRTAPGANPTTTREDGIARRRPLYDICLGTTVAQ